MKKGKQEIIGIHFANHYPLQKIARLLSGLDNSLLSTSSISGHDLIWHHPRKGEWFHIVVLRIDLGYLYALFAQ